jgi:hypothetical protein
VANRAAMHRPVRAAVRRSARRLHVGVVRKAQAVVQARAQAPSALP